jgi:hypothetical protein
MTGDGLSFVRSHMKTTNNTRKTVQYFDNGKRLAFFFSIKRNKSHNLPMNCSRCSRGVVWTMEHLFFMKPCDLYRVSPTVVCTVGLILFGADFATCYVDGHDWNDVLKHPWKYRSCTEKTRT